MRFLISFDPDEGLIHLSARIIGPLGSANAQLAFDTGATITMINQGILEGLGYDTNTADEISIITGSRIETVKELIVQEIQAIDRTVENMTVICHDLPEESGLDGLLGLNFLCNVDTEINYSNHTLILKEY